MNHKIKSMLLCLLLIATVVLAAGCSFEQTPYAINDSENFTVSVKFDANGGTFTDNAPVIVDSYDTSGMAVNANGKVEIPLLAPDDTNRDKDAFKPVKNGCFLAGWYAQRTESTDENGNVTYTYSEPWDFATDRVEADPNAQHTSSEPVFTLYAAWAPLYEIEFYALDSQESLGSYIYDPTMDVQVNVPTWDLETGAVNMYKFPSRAGYTFQGAYYDAEGKQAVTTETVTHPGKLNTADGTVDNHKLQLYVDYAEGEWYRISTAEQFADNFNLNGSYELLADLDFAEEIWPTAMMYGNFAGTIRGNGHTIKNVSVIQTDNAKANAGLFGQLTDTAALQDVTFENITLTVKKGARMTGSAYGLLCGTLSDSAKLENVAITGQLQIDSGCYFGTDDYTIGLLCGMGTPSVDYSGITCVAVGDAPESVVITVTENDVELAFVTE